MNNQPKLDADYRMLIGLMRYNPQLGQRAMYRQGLVPDFSTIVNR